MYDNKTIIKLHFDGASIRQIAERSKKLRNIISRIITAAKSVNLTLEQLDSLSDDELTLLLFPNKELMPVLSTWSYALLKKAPCRYTGSVYLDNMVIAAHNSKAHFKKLSQLEKGDIITFTDAVGNVFTYEVAGIEILQPEEVDDMTSGQWPLTLFTCTYGGASRVTVRCEKENESNIK